MTNTFVTTRKLEIVKVNVKGCATLFVYGKTNTEVFELIRDIFSNGDGEPRCIPASYNGKKRGRKPNSQKVQADPVAV